MSKWISAATVQVQHHFQVMEIKALTYALRHLPLQNPFDLFQRG
jgi:hypothetical protein